MADTNARVSIEPDGSVSEVELDKRFDALIEDGLRERIGSWRFEPVIENGQAVRVSATATLRLRADFEGSNQARVRVISARFIDPPPPSQDPSVARRTAPSYPATALRNGYGALVTLRIEVDDEGRVLNAAGESGWLTGPSTREQPARKLMRGFIDASIKAARSWQLPAPEQTGSRFYSIPFSFQVQGPSSPWRPAQWVEVEPEPWMLAADAAKATMLGESGGSERHDLQLLSELDEQG